jgi:hypothetical protein
MELNVNNMKKLLVIAIALVTVGLTSCKKEELTAPQSKSVAPVKVQHGGRELSNWE